MSLESRRNSQSEIPDADLRARIAQLRTIERPAQEKLVLEPRSEYSVYNGELAVGVTHAAANNSLRITVISPSSLPAISLGADDTVRTYPLYPDNPHPFRVLSLSVNRAFDVFLGDRYRLQAIRLDSRSGSRKFQILIQSRIPLDKQTAPPSLPGLLADNMEQGNITPNKSES